MSKNGVLRVTSIVAVVVCVTICSNTFTVALAQVAETGASITGPARGRTRPQGVSPTPVADSLRLASDLVTLDVTVENSDGRFMPGLDRSRFDVYEDGVKQRVEFFGATDAPVTLGVIFDASASMEGKLDRSREAIRRFAEMCNRDDELFLITFNDSAQFTRDFTASPEEITRKLVNVDATGNTALYDAIMLGLEKSAHGRHARRALLVVTDGEDNFSRYSLREAREAVREAGVQIYVIAVADYLDLFHKAMTGLGEVEDLADSTGGRAFFPVSEVELFDSCVRIALELRHQYSLAYYPTASGDGRWRSVKVRVSRMPGETRLSVRTRAGYFGAARREGGL